MLTTLPPSAFADPALRPGRREAGLLLAAAGLAVLLRLLLLEHRSFWWDEMFARYWMELPAAALLGEANRIETNPPLYFLALKLWAGLVGTRDGALRLPSALASGLAALTAGRLGTLAGGGRVGVLAALLCGLLPLGLFTGMNVRPLAFFPLFQGLCLLAAAEYLRRAAEAGSASALPGRTRAAWLALYAAAGLLQIHFHATGTVFVAATGAAIALACLLDRRLGAAALRDWLIAGGVIGLVSIPQGLAYLGLRDAAPIAWAQPPTPFTLLQVLGRALIAGEGQLETPLLRGLFVLGVGLAVGIAALGAWTLRGTLQVWPAVVLPGCFLLLLLAVSFLRPMWATRFLVGLIVPAGVLFAAGIDRLWRSRPGRGVAALFLLLVAVFNANQAFGRTEHREWFIPGRALARLLEAEPVCQGPVVVNRTYLQLPFWRHYGVRLADAEGFLLVEDAVAARGPVWHSQTLAYMHRAGLPIARSLGVSEFGALGAAAPHLSLVLRDDPTVPLSPSVGAALEALRVRFAVVREAAWGDATPPNIRLRVLCFADPRPPS